MMTKAAQHRDEPVQSKNPLDKMMTPAQVARRRFKSSLPRKQGQRDLAPMEAIGHMMNVFTRFMQEMEGVGLDPQDVKAAIVYYQPKTKGKEHVLAQTEVLPTKPADVGAFCEKILLLDKPVFLGMLFEQHDRKAEKNADAKQAWVAFGVPFTEAHDAAARLIAARDQLLKGGFKKVAN